MQRTFTILVVLLVLAGSPAVLATSSPADVDSEAAALDPVIRDVVRMLGEKVPAATVSAWLDRSGAIPGDLTPDDLIALTRAGAPDALVQKILALRATTDDAPAPPTLAAPKMQLGPIGAAEPPVRPTKGAPESPRTGPTVEVPVLFDLRYVPQMVEYHETPWDLFVYVDGRPLVRSDGWAAHSTEHLDRVTFSETLRPGRHVIRLIQEQHELRSKRKGTWSHHARVFDDPIVLDIDAAGAWEVDLRVKEGSGFVLGSLTQFEIRLEDEVVSEGSGPGPGHRTWPPLCEEVESRYPPDKRDSKAAHGAMKNCVRWDSLWGDVEAVADRATVREELQGIGFEPRPPDGN